MVCGQESCAEAIAARSWEVGTDFKEMAHNPDRKVLVIGLDVGDGKLIREWCRQEYLPNLNSLIANGTWGWLKTSAETLHVSGWPSLYTGTSPGKHGVYYTFQPAPGQVGFRRFGPSQYGSPFLWQLLSTKGKKCTIFDAPYVHPCDGLTGLQIFEWGTWAWYWKRMSIPRKLVHEMAHACGPYPLEFEANQIGLSAVDSSDLHRSLIEAAASKAKCTRWLMKRAAWDFFCVVFGETHPAAHYFWPKETDSEVPGSGPHYQFLRDVYVATDHAIGEILGSLDESVTVFIVSGDGVGPNHAGWHLLPEVLQRLGFTASRGSQTEASDAEQPGQAKPGSRSLARRMRDLIPADFRSQITRHLPAHWRDAFYLRNSTANIDWSKTRAFCLPTDLEGCIRINLKGRDPHGVVEDGREYEEVCQKLAGALDKLINPRTGRPAVHQILCARKTFSGERRDYLPDMIVLWSNEAPISKVRSSEVGSVEVASPDQRTGTHHPPGFVIARGPHVPKGWVLTGGDVVDFAPTVLAHFGIDGPHQMDGRPWQEVIGN